MWAGWSSRVGLSLHSYNRLRSSLEPASKGPRACWSAGRHLTVAGMCSSPKLASFHNALFASGGLPQCQGALLPRGLSGLHTPTFLTCDIFLAKASSFF